MSTRVSRRSSTQRSPVCKTLTDASEKPLNFREICELQASLVVHPSCDNVKALTLRERVKRRSR